MFTYLQNQHCQHYHNSYLYYLFFSLILFIKVYEARLFRLNKRKNGGLITSAEEAVEQQKKKSALNQFYWKLSQAGKSSTSATVRTEDDGKKRDAGEKVVVSELVFQYIGHAQLCVNELFGDFLL